MKLRAVSFLFRGVPGLLGLLGSAVLTPLFVAYLFIGTCGSGQSGFVLAFRAGRVAVTAAWCEAAPATTQS